MTILFLPAAACIIWIALNFFLARNTSMFWLLTVLLIVLAAFFTADAIYANPSGNTYYIAYTHLLSIFTGPCFIPLLWLYFDFLRRRKRHYTVVHYIWILIPVSLLAAAIALTGTLGRDAVAAFLTRLYTDGPDIAREYKGRLEWSYYMWASQGYRVVMILEFIVGFSYVLSFLIKHRISFVNVWRFFRMGESISIVELQLFTMILAALYILSKVFFFKDVFDAHPWVAVAQSVVASLWVILFMHNSLLGEKKFVTIFNLRHVMIYNYNPATKGAVVELMMEELLDEAEQESLLRLREKMGETLQLESLTPGEIASVKEKLFASAAGAWDDNLFTRFQSLMVNEQLFLQPSLSLQDVAERLHTNKTYISKLVNNTFNLGFPELLNTLRVDYAEQYLLSHRSAKQSEVAKACGFLSASSFNNVFKKITGVTPKVWLASNDKSNA